MKSFVPLTFLAGLLAAGCASDNSEFSSVPGPSGGKSVAVSEQTQPAHPQSQPPQPKPAPAPTAEQSQSSKMAPQTNSQPSQAVVTPDNSLGGKIVTYNSVGRFVVLRFPAGQMPKDGQTLFVYRGGLKVGELKISGEQRDDFIVADIVSGDAQAGDDVRDQ